MLRDLQLDMAKKDPLDDLLYSNYKKYSTRKSKINSTSNIREHPLDEHLKRNLVGQGKGAEIIWKEKTENKGNYIQKSHPPAMNTFQQEWKGITTTPVYNRQLRQS